MISSVRVPGAWPTVAALAVGVQLALVGAGCNSGSEDSRTVSGRARSVTSAAAGVDTMTTTLRVVETGEQATGLRQASFELVATVASATGAALRSRGGATEERLEPRPPVLGLPTFGLRVVGTPDEVLARFPAGAYTVVADRPDGSQPTASLLLAADRRPAAPTIESPADLAAGVSTRPVLRWSAPASPSIAARFDVTIVDVATGAQVLSAPDVLVTTLTVPASAPLSPLRRYRLEVRAVSGPASDAIRLEAGVTTLFDTGAP